MPEIEERQAKIEGILEQIDKRISSLESEFHTGFTQIHTEISQNRTEITQNRNEISQIRIDMISLFKWSIGIMITMWITIIITILFKT